MKIITAATLDDALNALGAYVAKNEERSEKNFIFCEDRLTLLAERAVLAHTGGATFTSEVTTFARFLSNDKKVLSKEGSVVVLSALMQQHKKELTCFSETQAQAVYETIAQLLSSRVDAALLRSSAEKTEGTLKRKLSDLALLLEGYGEFLKNRGYLDENGYLALLPEKIASGELKDKNVFFFAFSSFTAQAREGIRAAVENARSVTGIFLSGKEELYTNEGVKAFKKVLSEYGPYEEVAVPSSLKGDAARFATALFAPEKCTGARVACERIATFRACDEEEEADVVCALIKRHVREGLRYRDIAVLIDGDDFSAWEKTFRQYDIPYFADKKRAFSTHPFCKFLLSVLECIADGGTPESVDAVLSNIYFGDGDEYRNYLLKYGCYRGAYAKEIASGTVGENLSALAACQQKLKNIVAVFLGCKTGAQFCAGVRRLREEVREERVSENLVRAASGAERAFLNLAPLDEVLSEIEAIAGDRKFKAREMAGLLESGLGAVSVSMIPQYLDCVFLGDSTGSKFKRVKVLFCTGLTDALPRVTNDTAVIGDSDIEKLHDLSVEIEPAVAIVNLRARESLALNLTSFEEKLYLSYPVKRAGEECAPSEIFYFYKNTFKKNEVQNEFYLSCCSLSLAQRMLALLKDDFEAGRESDGKKYSTLYSTLQEMGVTPDIGKEGGMVASTGAGALYFRKDISPTLLEGYFECPYLNFVERGLNMHRREEGALDDSGAGTFVHEVLQSVASEYKNLRDIGACRALARQKALELFMLPKYARLTDTREGKYAAERIAESCERVAAAFYEQMAGSDFKVPSVEEKIKYPELSLSGKADRIDEAEGFVRIVDYKTGSFDASAAAYYTGRKLQLELYLLAGVLARTKGSAEEIKPAGAFYFPAKGEFSKEGDPPPYRMVGFYSTEEKVSKLMDTSQAAASSAYYENSARAKRGMPQDEFEEFLRYSVLVSKQAEEEMRAGNITPTPYQGVCDRCKAQGMCGFTGKARSESAASCKEIAEIVRTEEGKA